MMMPTDTAAPIPALAAVFSVESDGAVKEDAATVLTDVFKVARDGEEIDGLTDIDVDTVIDCSELTMFLTTPELCI